MSRQQTRTARIEARISPDGLRIVKRAAEIQGRSVSDFVVAAAQEEANRTIEQPEIIRLAVEDQRIFAEAIFNPPPLTPAMERAIERYRRVVEPTRRFTPWSSMPRARLHSVFMYITASGRSSGVR